MHRHALLLAWLLVAAVSLAGCGGGQDRPVVVGTFPASGASLAGTIQEIRFTFDDPVTLLNPAQIAVNSDGIVIPLVPYLDPDDSHSILVRPGGGSFWRAGPNAVTIWGGWEVNDAGHYRLESYRLTFTLGTAQPVFLGVPAPASVVQVEGAELAHVATVPAPGGRAPAGLTCSNVASDQRVWVQLASGGGAGEALAWFQPGDAAMTSVSLTHGPGGDLIAERPALLVDAQGAYVYAAYRDTALERIRLHRVEVATGLETDTLVLSPAASAGTSPRGLALTPDGAYVDVACATGLGARLVAVDLESFTEIDLGPGPGVDGLPLPAGAGPVVDSKSLSWIAPTAATEAILSAADAVALTVDDLASVVVGSPRVLMLTPDTQWLLTGLTGFVDGEAFSYRLRRDRTDERFTVIDDDTGAGNGAATSVLDVAWVAGTGRLLALLDNDAAIFLSFLSSGIEQVDLDDTTPQAAVDISGVAPGATLIAIPPPSVLPAP